MDSRPYFFNGKPNSDDMPEAIAQGDYRTAQLLRNGTVESAGQYSRESYRGNAVIVNAGLPAGTNVIVGTAKDVNNATILYFVYNSNDDHTIWQVNTNTNGITKVLQSEYLDFSPTSTYVFHSFVVNGCLFWCARYFNSFLNDDYYEPRSLNIREAIAFTAGLPSEYTVITRQTLSFIKWPPYKGPSASYSTDLTQEANYLYGKMYRFRYRYFYIDNEPSVLSPYSNLPLLTEGDFVTGRDWSQTQVDNTIDIEIMTGPDIVQKIEVLVSINNGPFSVFSQIDKTADGIGDNTLYSLTYKGNEALMPIDQTDRNYDAVPIVSGGMEFLSPSNQIAFADRYEGFDNSATEFDWTVDVVANEIRNKVFQNVPMALGYAEIGGSDVSYIAAFGDYSVDYFYEWQAGDTFTFAVTNDVPDQVITYVLTQDDVDAINGSGITAVDRVTKLFEILGAYIDGILGITSTRVAASGYIYLTYTEVIFSDNPSAFQQRLYYYRKSDPNIGLFKGAITEFGIQYYDSALRDGTVIANVTQQLYVPSVVEQDKSDFDDANNPYFARANVQINHLAPTYAKYYQLVTRNVPILGFQERTVVTLESDPDEPFMFKLHLDGVFEQDYRGNINHNIQVGDVVRFLRKKSSDVEWGDYLSDYLELQVLKYDSSAGYQGEVIWVAQFDYQASLGGEEADRSFLIQIYTPASKTENAPWREISEVFEIENPSTTEPLHHGTILSGEVSGLTTGNATFNLPNQYMPFGIVGRSIVLTTNITQTATITVATFDVANNTMNITINTPYIGTDVDGTFVIDLIQTSTLPAVIYSEYGNVYTRLRLMSTGFPAQPKDGYYPIDDFYYSDYYISNFNPQGRFAQQNIDAKFRRLRASMVHGGSYIQNSNTNNLCSFDQTNIAAFLDLDESFGAINKIVMVGMTLKALQDRKETSVYIKNTFGIIPGGEQTGFTNQTFAAVNPSEESFGCIHPNSVRVIDRQVFYFDFYTGTVVRSGNNGIVDICAGNYKYQNAILQFKTDVLTLGTNAMVSSYLDEANKEYAVTAVHRSLGTFAQGHVFEYTQNQWSHTIPYSPLFSENLGTYLISSVTGQGNIYRHGTGTENTFYGTQYPSTLTFCFNDEADIIKFLRTIGLKTNKFWTVESAKISANESYTEMETSMSESMFTSYEGHLWSMFNNDQNNVVPQIPRLATTQLARKNGRRLRGKAVTIKLSHTPSDGVKVQIFSARIVFELASAKH